jgi:hypothetical protein
LRPVDMRTMSIPVMLVLVAGFMALSGCVSNFKDSGEFSVPKDAGSDAVQRGIEKPYRLVVTVVNETPAQGTISGAAVVFFTSKLEMNARGFFISTTLSRDALAAGRTGSDGKVFASLEPGRSVSIAVGDVDGRTTEVLSNVVLGAPGASGNVTVALYMAKRSFSVSGAMPLKVSGSEASLGVLATEHQNLEIKFHDDASVHKAYLERALSISGTLYWNNTASGHGDLFAGFAVGNVAPQLRAVDSRDLPMQSNLKSSLEVSAERLEPLKGALGSSGALFGSAITRNVALTYQGLPISFAGSADFKASEIVIRS